VSGINYAFDNCGFLANHPSATTASGPHQTTT